MKAIDKLKVDDSIGIFSPSSPITYSCPKRFQRAKNIYKKKDLILLKEILQESMIIIDLETLKKEQRN